MAGRRSPIGWFAVRGDARKLKVCASPPEEENFRHGGRSARGLEVRCCAAVFYVMAESHDPQGKQVANAEES